MHTYKKIILYGFLAVLLIVPAVIFRVWTFEFWDDRGIELFNYLSNYGQTDDDREEICLNGDEGEVPVYVAVMDEEINEFVLRKADALLEEGKCQEALEEMEKAESKKIWTFDLAMLKSRAYCVIGDYEKAETAINKALEMPGSQWIEAAPILFDINYSLCRYKTALDIALEALAIEPRNLEFLICRNLVYVTYNQYDKAIAGIREALEIKPGDPGLLLNLAGAYWDMGKHEEGLKYALQVEKLLPDYGETHRVLSDLYVGLKQYDKAFDEIDKAVKIDGLSNSDNYIDRGRLFLRKKNMDAALQDALTAVRISPKKWSVYSFLGNVYHEKGEFDLALEAYNNGERYGNGDYDLFEVWMSRGNLYLDTKEYDKALAEYTKVIDVNPDYWAAYIKRADTYCAMSNLTAALDDLLNVEPRVPDENLGLLAEHWEYLRTFAHTMRNEEIERTASEHIERLEPEYASE